MRPLANLFNFKKSIFTESYKYFITTNITKGAELRKIDKKYEKWPTVFILIKKLYACQLFPFLVYLINKNYYCEIMRLPSSEALAQVHHWHYD